MTSQPLSNSQHWITLSPLGLTAFLVVWTLAVYRFTAYGDWEIYPAVAVFPLALLLHIVLVITQRPRMAFALYGLVHLLILAIIWLGCLMLISKDSL
jgi:hypothetical protein